MASFAGATANCRPPWYKCYHLPGITDCKVAHGSGDCHRSGVHILQLILLGMCGVCLLRHITNEAILKRCDLVNVDREIEYRRLKWLGHEGHMADARLPRCLRLHVSGINSTGRLHLMWSDLARVDFILLGRSRGVADVKAGLHGET